MRHAIRWIGCVFLGLHAGCGPGEMLQCVPTEEGVSDLSAWTSLGFAPQELIDALTGQYNAPFDLEDDSPTELLLEMSYENGPVVITTYEGENCSQPTLSVTVNALFQTANGDFDEAGTTRLVATEPGAAAFTMDWEAYVLNGDWEAPDLDEPSDIENPFLSEFKLEVRGTVEEGGQTSGKVEAEATFEGVDDDDEWASQDVDFEVAEWATSPK